MAVVRTKGLELTHVPFTQTGMLIRKPVADVFEALINPDITAKFWFTKARDRQTDSMGLGNVRRLVKTRNILRR